MKKSSGRDGPGCGIMIRCVFILTLLQFVLPLATPFCAAASGSGLASSPSSSSSSSSTSSTTTVAVPATRTRSSSSSSSSSSSTTALSLTRDSTLAPSEQRHRPISTPLPPPPRMHLQQQQQQQQQSGWPHQALPRRQQHDEAVNASCTGESSSFIDPFLEKNKGPLSRIEDANIVRSLAQRWIPFRSQPKPASSVEPHHGEQQQQQQQQQKQPTQPKRQRRWQFQASYLSPRRLFFHYATPLLQAATHRTLQVTDAMPLPADYAMEPTVSSLGRLYAHAQQHQQQRQESIQQPEIDNVVNQQAWLLTKALLLHQRGTLIETGILRLFNTMIQAFPAILVSRLLRLIEAGPAQPAGKALRAAVALVAVLTLKMVVENQFFQYVVLCSTQVRGSLAGLIFDKSLRLSSGGSGVTYQPNESIQDKQEQQQQQQQQNENRSTANNNKPESLGAGGVLNLMQSDTSIIESAAMQFHTVWDGPLQIAIFTSLLFRYLGPSVIWGIGVLLLTIPLNSVTLRILNRLSSFENKAKDARTKRTAESINNMKLLKLQGWEQQFANDIRQYRREELRRHVTRGMVRAFNSAVSNAVPALVLVVTLTAYAKEGRPIVASTIFTAISLFNQLRFPLFFYPMLIDSLANGKNAMRRIASYLSEEEIAPYVTHRPPLELPISNRVSSRTNEPVTIKGGSIVMKNGNFLWSVTRDTNPMSLSSAKDASRPSDAVPALLDINLQVNPGEVLAVVGGVGSGKSALVKGLLGELNPVSRIIVEQSIGSTSTSSQMQPHVVDDEYKSMALEKSIVVTYGNIAYCSQEAWLPKGTIQEAILFGREYDEARYMAAIRDAGLDNDIVNDRGSLDSDDAISRGVLSHSTDVGEGGSSLSGGQRARVALARALYSGDDTKVFLLDDCLAALDASVGSTVFERLTKRLKESNAAALLVTNDPSLPRRCDRVVLVGNVAGSSSCSTIVDAGTYDELIARGHNLRTISITDHKDSDEMSAQLDRDVQFVQSSPIQEIKPQETLPHIIVNGVPQSDVYGASFVPHLTPIARESIKVIGGYEPPINGTDITCHADPECQIGMEKCPEYLAEQGSNPKKDGYGAGHIVVDVVAHAYRANSTLITMIEEPAEAGQTNPIQAEVSEAAVTKRVVSADDAMFSGAIPFSTYVSYVKAVRNPILVLAMLCSYLLSNSAQFFQQYTVAKWTELGSGAMAEALGMSYLRSLVKAAGIVSVFLWFRSFLTMQVGVRASEFLHSRMLSSVFSAPMSFFDATPSGQLLSRFGKEIETVDRGVPDSIGSVLFCFLQIFMSIGALAGVITPGMIIPLAAVGLLYVRATTLFRLAARDLKRVETKTRSPIYTHFGEALRGTDIIRSVPGAPARWSANHRSLSDTNLSVFYTVKSLDRWLSTRLETLGNTVVLTAAIASVFLTRAGHLRAGSAGWGLTQALSITGLLTWAVRCLTDLETNMMSVMRVKELTDIDSEKADTQALDSSVPKMPKEASGAGDALEPLLPKHMTQKVAPVDSKALVMSGWPWRGNIRFKNASMRYNPSSPLVLNGVSVDIPAGSTLGVVGRTGSGKSSLMLTLFRLVEIEAGGSIEIDGVDIRSVSLESLRQSLAIIPQDPVLFAGSVAYNLDATNNASSQAMWTALDAASPRLAQQFRRAEGLDTIITEGGKNLSLGQRQLICLARALLRGSKILCMDEATSSVDSQTDQEVQETIRREFVNKGVTVITVAHRLDTVLGYNRIAVLGNGHILEYGSPRELLQNPRGELRRLVDADRRSKRKGGSKAKKADPLVTA